MIADDNDFLLMHHPFPVVRLASINLHEFGHKKPQAGRVLSAAEVVKFMNGPTGAGLFGALAGCDYSQCYFSYQRKVPLLPFGDA